MKSIKVIGIAVATLGVAASIGGAIALYTKSAQQAYFNIGAGTYSGSSGTINYTINGNNGTGSVAPKYFTGAGVEDTSASGIQTGSSDTAVKQIKYEFALGATFAQDLVTQNYALGNLKIDFSSSSDVEVYAVIDGYADGTWAKTNYGAPLINNVTFNSSTPVAETSYSRDVSVSNNGSQVLVIWLKYNTNSIDLISKNEAALDYSLTVTWDAPSSAFDPAYVTGDGVGWTDDFSKLDAYIMAPDITSTNFRWVFNGLERSSSWTKAKCILYHKADGGDHPNPYATWATGDDYVLSAGANTLYWDGSGAVSSTNA